MSSNRPSSDLLIKTTLANQGAVVIDFDTKGLERAVKIASERIKNFNKGLKKTFDEGNKLNQLSKRIDALSERFINPSLCDTNLHGTMLCEEIADMFSIDLKHTDKKIIKKSLSDVKKKIAEFEKIAVFIEKQVSSTAKEFKTVYEQLGILMDMYKETLRFIQKFKDENKEGPEGKFIISHIESAEKMIKSYEDLLRMKNNLHNATIDRLEDLQMSVRFYANFRKRIHTHLKDPLKNSISGQENSAARFFSQPNQGETYPTPEAPMQRLFHT